MIVVGAGDAGRLIVQEMQRSRMLNYTPIGFIDDDPRKQHTRIMGVRVLGAIDDLPRVLREHRPDELLDRDAVRLGRGAPPDRRDRAAGEGRR